MLQHEYVTSKRANVQSVCQFSHHRPCTTPSTVYKTMSHFIHSQILIDFKQYGVDLFSIFRNIEKWQKTLARRERVKTLVVASLVPQSQLYRLLAAVLPTSLQTNTVAQQSGKIERWCNNVEARIQLTLRSNHMLKRSTDVYIYCIYKSYIPQHHLNLCTKNNMQEMEG